jgi:hypothetical protein
MSLTTHVDNGNMRHTKLREFFFLSSCVWSMRFIIILTCLVWFEQCALHLSGHMSLTSGNVVTSPTFCFSSMKISRRLVKPIWLLFFWGDSVKVPNSGRLNTWTFCWTFTNVWDISSLFFFLVWIPFYLQAVQIHSANGVKLLEAWRGVPRDTQCFGKCIHFFSEI